MTDFSILGLKAVAKQHNIKYNGNTTKQELAVALGIKVSRVFTANSLLTRQIPLSMKDTHIELKKLAKAAGVRENQSAANLIKALNLKENEVPKWA